mmetsp:Transcript_56437/g.158318  ORF Transcript_56437/g.158318 Transcript_56437/m.158318 type:complete len:98 (-) Transcript_56437:127-420(-)
MAISSKMESKSSRKLSHPSKRSSLSIAGSGFGLLSETLTTSPNLEHGVFEDRLECIVRFIQTTGVRSVTSAKRMNQYRRRLLSLVEILFETILRWNR